MATGPTSYMREGFAVGLIRKSVPQNKVAARLRWTCCVGVYQKCVNTVQAQS